MRKMRRRDMQKVDDDDVVPGSVLCSEEGRGGKS